MHFMKYIVVVLLSSALSMVSGKAQCIVSDVWYEIISSGEASVPELWEVWSHYLFSITPRSTWSGIGSCQWIK